MGMTVNLSRRAFVFGAAATASAALTTPAQAGQYRNCFLGICGPVMSDEEGLPSPSSKDKSKKNSTPAKAGYLNDPDIDTQAFKFFSALGIAIEENRFNGKCDALIMDWHAHGAKQHPSPTTSISFKRHDTQKPYDWDKLYRACACKDGTLPDRRLFERHKHMLLGMLAYLTEENTPDKPKDWDSTKPYTAQADMTSVFRSIQHNKDEGGKPLSCHIVVFAMDIKQIGLADGKHIAVSLKSNEAKPTKTTAVYYPNDNFSHCDPREAVNDWKGYVARLLATINYKHWQKTNSITPFSTQRCILPSPINQHQLTNPLETSSITSPEAPKTSPKHMKPFAQEVTRNVDEQTSGMMQALNDLRPEDFTNIRHPNQGYKIINAPDGLHNIGKVAKGWSR